MLSYTLADQPFDWFILPPQARTEIDEARDRELMESLRAEGQHQPVLATTNGTLIFGFRRHRMGSLAGLKTLRTIVTDEPLTEAQVLTVQLSENIHRLELSGPDLYRAYKKLLELNKWKRSELAAHVHKDPSSVTHTLSPDDCIPAVREAFLAGKVTIKDCCRWKNLPEAEQARALARKLGTGGDDGGADPLRAKRLRITVANDNATGLVTVATEADDLGWEDVILLLTEAMKLARKEKKQGTQPRTAEALWSERAAALA